LLGPPVRLRYDAPVSSPTRFLIIGVLAVAGILVLANAFDVGTTRAVAPASPAPTETKPPKVDQTKEPKPEETEAPEEAGTLDGVRIQVFNGTSTTGLAAQVQDSLDKAGDPVLAGEPGNANANEAETVVYYRDRSDRANAEYIAKRYFDGAAVEPMSRIPAVNVGGVTTEVSKEVEVAIIVGEDYSR
jgi:hypothetical protein